MYEPDEKRYVSVNHPFTSMRTWILESEPLVAKAHDLVLNGVEIGGGSLRIHERELQERGLQTAGLSRKGHVNSLVSC